MSNDFGPVPDFGPGSTGIQWQPPPGWDFAGDAWCWDCPNGGQYVPSIRSGEGPAVIANHGGCAGSGKLVRRGSVNSGGLD